MKNWKVILATLVIYTAGIATGSLLIRQTRPPSPPRPFLAETGPIPGMLQERFLERMKIELGLTPAQEERLRRIFSESRERIQILNSLLAPEVQEELRYLREEVRAELTPDQQRRFEELRRERPRWQQGNPQPGPRRFFPPPGGEPTRNFQSQPSTVPRTQRPPPSDSPPGAPERLPHSRPVEPPR